MADGVLYLVALREAVVGDRELQVLVRQLFLGEDRAEDRGDVLAVPHQSHAFAQWLACHPLECGTTEEIMIEVDDAAVAELVRIHVPVPYVRAVEAPGELVPGLPAVRRQPLTEAPEVLGGIDGGQGVADPAALLARAEVRPRPTAAEPVLLARLQDRVAHCLSSLERSREFDAEVPGHAMTESQNVGPGDADAGGPEESDFWRFSLDRFGKDAARLRAVHAEPEIAAPSGRVVRGVLVPFDCHIETAGLGLEVHPVE